MGGLHALCWMVAYVIENRPELLQESDNKLVCIVIPSSNPRLKQFHQFTAPGPYTDYVNPGTSLTIVKVYLKNSLQLNFTQTTSHIFLLMLHTILVLYHF